jgi:hypothetical protein
MPSSFSYILNVKSSLAKKTHWKSPNGRAVDEMIMKASCQYWGLFFSNPSKKQEFYPESFNFSSSSSSY